MRRAYRKADPIFTSSTIGIALSSVASLLVGAVIANALDEGFSRFVNATGLPIVLTVLAMFCLLLAVAVTVDGSKRIAHINHELQQTIASIGIARFIRAGERNADAVFLEMARLVRESDEMDIVSYWDNTVDLDEHVIASDALLEYYRAIEDRITDHNNKGVSFRYRRIMIESDSNLERIYAGRKSLVKHLSIVHRTGDRLDHVVKRCTLPLVDASYAVFRHRGEPKVTVVQEVDSWTSDNLRTRFVSGLILFESASDELHSYLSREFNLLWENDLTVVLTADDIADRERMSAMSPG